MSRPRYCPQVVVIILSSQLKPLIWEYLPYLTKVTSFLRPHIYINSVGSIRALDRNLGRFVNILVRQVEQA